jgi:aminoglycoside phosphotransferase (APT) family kinase protein
MDPDMPAFSPDEIAARLNAVGRTVTPATLHIERREDRLLLQWPGDELAWMALDASGAARLAYEGRVLTKVRSCCTFTAPEERHRSLDGTLSIRCLVRGRVDLPAVHQRIHADPLFAAKLARWLGRAMAQLHACFANDAAPSWLARKVGWPMPHQWILERLPRVLGQQHSLLLPLQELLQRYYYCSPSLDDLVLVHTDLGLHNIVFDPSLSAPVGIIDFESAAFADRHHDFRYLPLDMVDTTLLDEAVQTYESLTQHKLERARILLYHAACACCYLAFRDGIAPETYWCGRTLEQDLAWTRDALAHLARC